MEDLVEGIFAAARERALKDHLPYFGAVSPSDAYAVLRAAPDARLIDVRTRPEWDYVGHVPDSSLLEWNTYPDGRRNPEFLDQLRIKAPDTSAPVFFLCRSGQRSDGAARMAAAASRLPTRGCAPRRVRRGYRSYRQRSCGGRDRARRPLFAPLPPGG